MNGRLWQPRVGLVVRKVRSPADKRFRPPTDR